MYSIYNSTSTLLYYIGLLEHANGMSLGVEHESVLAGAANLPVLVCNNQPRSFVWDVPRTFSESQVAIFQKLGKEEALLVVNWLSAVWRVHVSEALESGVGAAGLVDGLEGVPDPLTVLISLRDGSTAEEAKSVTYLVFSGDAPGIVEALDHFRSQDVISAGDVETGSLEELLLAVGDRLRVPTKGLRADLGDSLSVGGMASLDEFQAEVAEILAAQDASAKKEVAPIKASEMLRIQAERTVIVGRQESQVRTGGRVRGKVLHGRLGSSHPAVLVETKPLGVVDVHLDQVLVEGVVSAIPADGAINKFPGLDINFIADEAREWLSPLRLGVEQIRLGFLGEFGILIIPSQIRQARPFQNQSAGHGETIGLGSVIFMTLDVDVVVRNARGSVEGKLQSICQVLGLLQQSFDLGVVLDQVLGGTVEKIVSGQHTSKVPDSGFEDAHQLVRFGVIDLRDIIEDLVDSFGVAHYDRGGQGVDGRSTPAISGFQSV